LRFDLQIKKHWYNYKTRQEVTTKTSNEENNIESNIKKDAKIFFCIKGRSILHRQTQSIPNKQTNKGIQHSTKIDTCKHLFSTKTNTKMFFPKTSFLQNIWKLYSSAKYNSGHGIIITIILSIAPNKY
jgi:hypothetical protein